MQWIYLIHEFHNLSWITEINELFHNILIYRDAPVYTYTYTHMYAQYVCMCVYIYKYIYIHCKKKSVKFTVKNWQLWLPEFSRKKYGNNILGFTVLT